MQILYRFYMFWNYEMEGGNLWASQHTIWAIPNWRTSQLNIMFHTLYVASVIFCFPSHKSSKSNKINALARQHVNNIFLHLSPDGRNLDLHFRQNGCTSAPKISVQETMDFLKAEIARKKKQIEDSAVLVSV